MRAGLALLLVPALLRADSAAEATRAPAPAIAAARHDAAATAVARALAAAPNPGGAVQLRASSLVGERLTLDFSREALDLAPGSLAFEQFSRVVHRAAAEELRGDFAHFEIQTLIEGVPLDRLLAVSDRPAPPRAPALLPPATPPVARSLATRRIAVSPGHGYYQNAAGAWVLQRGYWQGIVEDFLNHDMITLVRDELAAAGADVHPARNLDRAAGPGESGFPKWQEAARYHVKALGADASVWNEPGYDHLSQDIRCRPRWANAIGADILVSLHNNGGGGTGTETLYDTNNGFGPESRRLADAVHNRVIAAIRRDYQPAWTDRRVQGFNGNYGENRLATRPSILIEVAFMDRPTPDNAALQDEAFKRLVARAIREGIQEYFDGPAALPPAAPSTLLASAAPGGGVTLTWRDLSNNETGFRLERRTVGAGTPGAAWAPLATIGANLTTYADTSAAAGTAYVYRVAAVNAAGTSGQFSNEATVLGAPVAVPPAPGRPTPWLANVSLRTTLGAGQGVTVGFVVGGGTREVLVRAAGPALGAFGVAATMPDPRLDLFRDQSRLADNNDWPVAYAPVMAALGAFPFAAASRDAALLQSVAGPHTVVAAGPVAGAVLVELYDSGGGGSGRLVNLSARHRVGTGADLLIAGFHVAGTGAARLLVRAVGPALTPLGVTGALANPRLEIFDATGTKLAENDDWDAGLAPAFAAAGAFALPAASRDAALVLTLTAGRGYTAQVSGVGGTTGEALIEVYELP